MQKDSPIYVSGHTGLVGGAIVRALKAQGYNNIICAARRDLDLTDQASVQEFFQNNKIDNVIHCAGKVGGIVANDTQPSEFLYENAMMAMNVIHAAHAHHVQKFIFIGSSCMYPKMAAQPIKEEALFSGGLEPTNSAYAVAKLAGLEYCRSIARQYNKSFLSVIPTNVYGIGDNFHPEHSHVIPGLMRRIHNAKMSGDARVMIWGSGTPLREFIFADDLADAVVHVLGHYKATDPLNIGSGEEVSIKEIAEVICDVVGYNGDLEFDHSKPDGVQRKALDCSKLQDLDWTPRTQLKEGLQMTYDWAKAHVF